MGKTASKLKKKRSQSVVWNFRFPSISSLNRTKMARPPLGVVAAPINGTNSTKYHLDIRPWLETLDLGIYADAFSRFNGVEDMLYYSEEDIRNLGVKNSAHRARIISSLLALRIKYERGTRRNKENSLQRHSVAVDSRSHAGTDCRNEVLEAKTGSPHPSKSLNDLLMEHHPSPQSPAPPTPPKPQTPTSTPPPPTSRDESPVSETGPALKKALEWELSLDARDLRSHAWYHGAIPRARAEEIVQQDGDFLVRDCSSQPPPGTVGGHGGPAYVLSCRVRGQPLHFVINKVVIQPDTVYERVQYRFEDDAYDTVPDLITFYVGSGKPISAASGARIQYPRNRMYPLSFYATKYPSPYPPSRLVSPVNTPLSQQPQSAFRYTPYAQNSYNKLSSPSRTGPEVRPRLPAKKHRSQSLTPAEAQHRATQEKCNSADGVIQSPLMTRSVGSDNHTANFKFSTHSLPRTPCSKMSLPPNCATVGRPSKHIVRVTSDPALSPCAERRRLVEYEDGENEEDNIRESPPPKPSRIPSLLRTDSKDSAEVQIDGRISEIGFAPHGSVQRVSSYHASGSDSGNGSGDSAQSSATGDSVDAGHRNSGVVIRNPRYIMANSESSITLKNMDFDYVTAEEQIMKSDLINIEMKTKYDLDNFHTLLLPATENKPLDATALQGIKVLLKESGPRILANHLTRIDLQIILGDKDKDKNELQLGSGIELCSLPHGHQLRLDLIERTVCLKLLVAVSILTCPTNLERADFLNKWIEVAIDTKTALGNLFGFCGIMLGLCSPQVQRLESTWHILRQKYTDSAFNFEAKLRPTLKSMNECNNPQAPNTTIPHLLPVVLLQERTIDNLTNVENSDQSILINSCLTPWESKTPDFGLTVMFNHIETARKFNDNISMFKRNAEIILGDTCRIDELMLDAFRTEFHLKFLWGSRCAYSNTKERHEKFERVLNVLADKYSDSNTAES